MRSYSSIYIILVLWLAGLCAAAQFAKMGLFLPELQQLYPDAGIASGFLITLISLVGALLGLVAGILVGKIGPRNILLSGLIAGSLISVIQSFNLPLTFLLITRVLEGATHLAIVVAAPTLISLYSSDRLRAFAMTLWGTFFGVSFALTAWLGLPFVAAQGIHALFFAHALMLSFTTLLVLFVIPKQGSISSGAALKFEAFSLKGLYTRHKQAWCSPHVAAPASGWLFYTITFVALLAILPGLLPVDQRAFVAGAMPLASIMSSMTIGVVLLWRYTAVQVLFLLVPNKALVCVLLFLALGLVQGSSFAAIPQLNATPAKQALAYGALAQAGNIGNLCGTPLLLFLYNYGGSKAMIALVVACYITAICVHLSFGRRRALIMLTDNTSRPC